MWEMHVGEKLRSKYIECFLAQLHLSAILTTYLLMSPLSRAAVLSHIVLSQNNTLWSQGCLKNAAYLVIREQASVHKEHTGWIISVQLPVCVVSCCTEPTQ